MLVSGIALGSVCHAPSESEASEEKPKCNWAGGSREGVNGIYTSALRKGTARCISAVTISALRCWGRQHMIALFQPCSKWQVPNHRQYGSEVLVLAVNAAARCDDLQRRLHSGVRVWPNPLPCGWFLNQQTNMGLHSSLPIHSTLYFLGT